MQPIVTLSLPLDDASELYRALMMRYFVESTLRREQGLEPISVPALAERLEHALQTDQEASEKEIASIEDELWQHAWLAFTDEWAWHRAKEDVLKELGTSAKRFKQEELERLTEQRYEKKFEAYQKEVELPGHKDGAECEWSTSPKHSLAKTKKGSRKS